MYADEITESMKYAIDETNRRREIQSKYNKENNITPQTVVKRVRDVIDSTKIKESGNDIVNEIATGKIDKNGSRIGNDSSTEVLDILSKLSEEEQNIPIDVLIEKYTEKMAEAAGELRYEDAAYFRDIIKKLKKI